MILTKKELRMLILEQLQTMAGPGDGGGGDIDPYINIDYYDKNKDGVLSREEELARQEVIKQKRAKRAKQRTPGITEYDNKALLQVIEVISLIDPTGIASWPALYVANEEYEKNPSTGNSIKLGLAFFGIIPLIGKGTKFIKLANWFTSLGKAGKSKVSKNILSKVTQHGDDLWEASPKITDIFNKNELYNFLKKGLSSAPESLKKFLKDFKIDESKLDKTLESITSTVYAALSHIDKAGLVSKWHKTIYYINNTIDLAIGKGLDTDMGITLLDFIDKIASGVFKPGIKVSSKVVHEDKEMIITKKAIQKIIKESIESRLDPNK